MKILAEEVALREETRELQQACPRLTDEQFESKALTLSDTQEILADRAEEVVEKIIDLPDGEANFPNEIKQVSNAARAMWDAADILAQPNAGPPAIGAETEAIEWLLQAKRSGTGSGGGGGSPGDGNRSGADTDIAALALLGDSVGRKSVVEQREVVQATGKSGRELPEEFRNGLDRYFELLEGGR